jgi:hypothetical protein
MKWARCLTALALLTAGPALAQSVNLTETEVDNVRNGPWRLGPFYATPSIRISTGYDSNALSTTEAQSDIRLLAGPGMRLGLPMGNTAFLDLFQELDYVYYREQVDLRRFFNITRVGGGLGGRRFLLKVNDEFRDEIGRPTSEFDYPVEQRTNVLTTSATTALGWRHEIELSFQRRRFDIRQQELDDPVARDRLNRTEDRYGLTFRRHLTAKTDALAEGLYERYDFQDASRNGDSYGARFGFDFSPGLDDPLASSRPFGQAFLAGQFLLGFRTVAPFDIALPDFTGLIGSVDVTFGFGRRNRIQGVFSRDLVPSIFRENWYFVETRYGVTVSFPIAERLDLVPGAIFGTNDYPLPGEGGEDLFDDHVNYRLGVNYRVTEIFILGVTADYLHRDSNVTAFQKDRLQVYFNVSLQP